MEPPLTSLCMIARDEEAVLGRCLRSVAEYVDGGVGCDLLRSDAGMALAGDDHGAIRRCLDRILRCFDRETRDRGPLSDPSLAGPVARARAAEALLRLGRTGEAREMAASATRLPGSGATPWNALAGVERSAGDLQAALQAQLRGLKEDGLDPWAWAGMGEILLQAGDASAAVPPLENAAKLAPGWPAVERSLEAARLAIRGQAP